MSIRGLEAQTAQTKFAWSFATSLALVSEACYLHRRSDRTADQVVETLEAVNFLTTSGECFGNWYGKGLSRVA
jgi:hypothetical protein